MTVADLQAAENRERTLTLGAYLPTVIAAAGTGAHRTYWARMAAVWGDRRLSDEHRRRDPVERCRILALDAARPGAHDLQHGINAMQDRLARPEHAWRVRVATASTTPPSQTQVVGMSS
jgi:hypothetical protein